MKSRPLQTIVHIAHHYADGHECKFVLRERFTAALVLNRLDLLDGLSIAEALDCIGAEWAALIPAAARQYKSECWREDVQRRREREAMDWAVMERVVDYTLFMDANAKLTACSFTPGCFDCSLAVDATGFGEEDVFRLRLFLTIDDTQQLFKQLRAAKRKADVSKRPCLSPKAVDET